MSLTTRNSAPKWWDKKDVKQTFVFWVIITGLLGYIGGTVQVHSMGAPASSAMSQIISLMLTFTWAAAPVAGFVFAIMLTALLTKLHFGDNPPVDADTQVTGSPRANALWIVISAIFCLFALVVGLIALESDNEALLDKSAKSINVTGQQWVWSYDYTGTKGVRSETLHLVVNHPYVFHVTSKDVKHSFWIVQMGIKIDANPGYITEAAVTPNKIGTFDVRCAELCGLLHAYMQNKVIVQSQADYDAWVTSQPNTDPAQGGNA